MRWYGEDGERLDLEDCLIGINQVCGLAQQTSFPGKENYEKDWRKLGIYTDFLNAAIFTQALIQTKNSTPQKSSKQMFDTSFMYFIFYS